MSSYADTSFLFSLYVQDDESVAALSVVAQFSLPLSPLTALHRLELQNALSRRVFLGK